MLSIRNLTVKSDGETIVRDASLEVCGGELAILMGPNGSGKSTLARAVMGDPRLETEGILTFKGEDLRGKAPDERADVGIFLSFQRPPVIEGVNSDYFLQSIAECPRTKVKEFMRRLGASPDLLNKDLNLRFSGGEKKKFELLQAMLKEPEVLILDEIDSGLDVDSLKEVNNIIQQARSEGRGILVITHHARPFIGAQPDKVYVMVDGAIVEEDGSELLSEVGRDGFGRWKIES